jgi:hypothetical protein
VSLLILTGHARFVVAQPHSVERFFGEMCKLQCSTIINSAAGQYFSHYCLPSSPVVVVAVAIVVVVLCANKTSSSSVVRLFAAEFNNSSSDHHKFQFTFFDN